MQKHTVTRFKIQRELKYLVNRVKAQTRSGTATRELHRRESSWTQLLQQEAWVLLFGFGYLFGLYPVSKLVMSLCKGVVMLDHYSDF